jgi:hypothetical protein
LDPYEILWSSAGVADFCPKTFIHSVHTGAHTKAPCDEPRPRGFITDWRPRADTLALLDQVQAVLDEYADQLPLTLRQIFYRLVGAHGYEKTERAYDRLGEALNKARRARLVAMDAIRDDGFTSEAPIPFDSAEAFLDNAVRWAEELWLDRQRGQERRLVLWCEGR